MSKTKQALAWLKSNPDKTVYAAAKEFGMSSSTLYKAIKVRGESKPNRNTAEWQDIAYAPKDGTFIDVWVSGPNNLEGGRISDAYFSGGKWMHDYSDRYGPYEARLMMGDVVTHWAPIPEGPK